MKQEKTHMNVESAKVRVGLIRQIEAELAKGSKLVSLKQMGPARYEVIYTCPRMGLCRTNMALRSSSKRPLKK
jgi:hypothetical protein